MKQLITAILISYVLTVSAFAMSEQTPPSQRKQQQNEAYLGHLKYEYHNRGRTYLGMRTAAKYSADSDRGTFFQAYSDLENISRSARAMGRRRQGLHRFYANRRIRAKTAIESFQRESIAAH